ncbi:MAG: TonB-dependent receptor [Opitutaceae bacterium]
MGAWLALALAPAPAVKSADATAAVAAAGQSGTVEGRVLNTISGQYVKNARVTIEGTTLEAFTNDFGEYRFADVPTGAVTVKVSYTGFEPAREAVPVQAGQSSRRDFNLGPRGQTVDPQAPRVKLDPFMVAGTRETNGNNIAIAEQRFAPNVKNVVAADAFGDLTEGNIGELMKFLPGVTVDFRGEAIGSVAVRGIGANFTGVSQDGARLASGEFGRVFQFEQVSVNNISRVEVTKVPTPDVPSDSMGGSVNMVSKSAFESARTEFRYRAYFSLNSNAPDIFKRTPGPEDTGSYKVRPGFDFSYIAPLTPNLGLVVNGLSSHAFIFQHAPTRIWRFTGAGATPTAPYLRQFNYSLNPKTTDRESVSLKVDWRPAPDHVLSFGAQFAYYSAFFDERTRPIDAGSSNVSAAAGGANLTFGPTFTHGATGRGTVALTRFSQNKLGSLIGGNLAHRYTGRKWEIQSSLSISKSKTCIATRPAATFSTSGRA